MPESNPNMRPDFVDTSYRDPWERRDYVVEPPEKPDPSEYWDLEPDDAPRRGKR
jgi:hypothetical protein